MKPGLRIDLHFCREKKDLEEGKNYLNPEE